MGSNTTRSRRQRSFFLSQVTRLLLIVEQDNLSEEDGDGAIDFDVSGLQSSTPLTSRTGNDGISTRPLQGKECYVHVSLFANT